MRLYETVPAISSGVSAVGTDRSEQAQERACIGTECDHAGESKGSESCIDMSSFDDSRRNLPTSQSPFRFVAFQQQPSTTAFVTVVTLILF